jgi:hypothetical protein
MKGGRSFSRERFAAWIAIFRRRKWLFDHTRRMHVRRDPHSLYRIPLGVESGLSVTRVLHVVMLESCSNCENARHP